MVSCTVFAPDCFISSAVIMVDFRRKCARVHGFAGQARARNNDVFHSKTEDGSSGDATSGKPRLMEPMTIRIRIQASNRPMIPTSPMHEGLRRLNCQSGLLACGSSFPCTFPYETPFMNRAPESREGSFVRLTMNVKRLTTVASMQDHSPLTVAPPRWPDTIPPALAIFL